MTHNIGDQPIDPKYREIMNGLAKALDKVFNGDRLKKGKRDTGFVLMVFPFHDHKGRCNYISNAKRDDVVIMLKEQLARFSGMPTGEGHG